MSQICEKCAVFSRKRKVSVNNAKKGIYGLQKKL